MKRSLCIITVLTVLALGVTGNSHAQVKPVNLCLWDTVQLHPKSTTIHGLRLSVYGVNSEMAGVDIGVVPHVTGDFTGVQWGLVNLVDSNCTGYQEGFVNVVGGDYLGWQSGAVNITRGQFRGFQSALFNKAESVKGVQFAFVNITDSLYGLQVGLLNINNTPNPFRILPIVNWSF